jgi:hypothetical protein
MAEQSWFNPRQMQENYYLVSMESLPGLMSIKPTLNWYRGQISQEKNGMARS